MNKLIWAIIIFICAAIFRLTFLDLMEFKLDEARDVYEMEKFYQAPYFIQRGTIQSTGVYNPPLWYYILAVLSVPSRDPQYLSFMIALINCLAVAGFYLVVRRFYGQWVGVAAGLLLAFSPWAILFSRKIWAPDILLLFLVIWFYFLHRLILDKKPKAILGVLGMLGLLGQIHASGIFLAVAAIITLLLFRVRINIKYALVGLILGLIPLLPYVVYQFQNGCPDCQAFFNYQSEVKTFDINVFLRPFQLVGGSSFQIVLGDDNENFLEEFPYIKFFNLMFLAEFILGILGIVYLCSRWWLLAILGIVPLFYLITQTPAHLHYFVILLPIMMVIYSLGLNWFKQPWVSITIITFIIIINVIFMLVFYQFLDKRGNIQGDFGPIYKVTKKQAEEKLIQYRDRPDYELIKAEYYVKMFNNQAI